MTNTAYDVSHFFAGLMLVVSFALIYQDRVLAVLRSFAIQAIILSLAVAWEASVQDRPHLFITAALAFGLKGIIIPWALHQMIFKLGIHRDVEQVVGVGLTLLLGLGLTALSLMLVLKATGSATSHAREGLAIALAIILLGMLMMITRRNAVTQIIGFMSIENGLILGAAGARGMPLVVEISVAFSVLIALFVFAVFVFRIRERFDTVEIVALERVRGDRK
jgi:hydrogenase-4 component E